MHVVVAPGMKMTSANSRGRAQFDFSGDRLAPVGVGAVLRIETLSSFGERDKLTARRLEIVYMSIKILEVALQKLDDVTTCTFPGAPKVEDRGDLCERQPCCLSVANEPQPRHRIIVIVAIPVVGPLRFSEKPYALVIADRLGRDTCSSAEFSDPHDNKLSRKMSLTFHSAGRCMFAPSTEREGGTRLCVTQYAV